MYRTLTKEEEKNAGCSAGAYPVLLLILLILLYIIAEVTVAYWPKPMNGSSTWNWPTLPNNSKS